LTGLKQLIKIVYLFIAPFKMFVVFAAGGWSCFDLGAYNFRFEKGGVIETLDMVSQFE
jgi:hypothetical protein